MSFIKNLENKLSDYPTHTTKYGILVQASNMEIMNKFQTSYFDLLLTDPPYGIGEDGESNHSRGNGLGFEDYDSDGRQAVAEATMYTPMDWDQEIPPPEYFKKVKAITDNQIIFGGNYFQSIMVETDRYEFAYDNEGNELIRYVKKPALGATTCWIIWDKENGGTHFADCELAWTSFDTAVRKYGYRWNGMLRKNRKKEQRFHPTQKPIGLFREILQDYAKKGDIILDTHAGSCSTAVAAIDLGMKYLVIEREEEYFNKSAKRIEYFKHGWHSKTKDLSQEDDADDELPQGQLNL